MSQRIGARPGLKLCAKGGGTNIRIPCLTRPYVSTYRSKVHWQADARHVVYPLD